MSFIVVDVEADGPCPGEYSMVSLGAVLVEPTLSHTFYGEVAPVSKKWIPEALAISGKSRTDHERFGEPVNVMSDFADWIQKVSTGRPVFVSDNLAFDWMWICYYFHKYYGRNPFGYSGRRIGDMYCGLVKNAYAKWKFLRKTKHSHDPVDDAKGNAEVMLYMNEELGFNLGLR